MIGSLGLLCLVLIATLTFEAAEADRPTLALDPPSGTTATLPLGEPGPAGSTTHTMDSADALSSGSGNDALYTAEPLSIPAGLLTALEQAAEEPMEVEFERLLDAIQYGFGESSVQIEPTLRPYASRIAGRLNVRPTAFMIRVAAPDRALAEARARTLSRLFEAMGVVPGRLSFAPRAGAHGLSAEPT